MSGVKRARTTRTGTGSSSQEQEVADPMMTLERRMEYLRGRPVAKERPVTLSDFDQLLYEEHSLYQLFEYQGISSSALNSFHRVPFTRAQCMLLLGQQTRIDFPLYMFELIMDEAWEIKEYSLPYGVFLTQFLISRGVVIAASDTRKEVKSALNKFTLSRSRGQEGALTRRFARRAAAAVEEASRPSTSASEAPMETGAPVVPPPWVAQLFADFDSRVGATMKATLQPVERRMQSMEEQLKELRIAFDGECTVTMLRNKSVVAHMADVNEQLEEIKKTLDDFKMEADPQRIPGDIPDDVATFRDAVRR
ncbi:hypothetical protein CJ030_MR2G000734 [Morella rubra]|uniref:Uncharacterized protein n=1 Tax=Morella rubra TaxID=262757 RepID=A0A6A1WWW0_9ROSI|nr:hypothetical protein CJ030_MR2G000734 [Morella rubra]